MLIHSFGDRSKPVMLLIHGMLTPWQIWEDAAAHFSKDFFVVIPELDAHTEDKPSRFRSVEREAEKLAEYVQKNFGGRIYALCGLSMGGRIAAVLAGRADFKTEYLVLDGAPLKRLPGILISFMKKGYRSIIEKTKQRDPKVIESCKQSFLPERYHEAFFKLADNMENESIDRILESVFSDFEYKKYDSGMKLLFMHGTKGSESVSKRAALKMKSVNPQTKILCFEGYAHAQAACFEPDKWIRAVDRFITKP